MSEVEAKTSAPMAALPGGGSAASGVALLSAVATPSSCLVRALGLSVAADRVIGGTTSSVHLRWRARPREGLCAELAHTSHTFDATDQGRSLLLPMGHQGADESTASSEFCCPVLADDALDPRPPRRVRLGAVAIPVNGRNEVLLTRRPRSMRTFPGAWVLPGGSVDPGDATVVHAALRELEEETGIVAPLGACEQPAPFCLWESCFPTTFTEWQLQRACGPGARTAHFLISFVVVRLSEAAAAAPLRLQPGECDSACWVPLADVAATLCDDESADSSAAYPPAAVEGDTSLAPLEARSLAGVYPNGISEGVGRGHLWALRRLHERESQVTLK